MRLRWVFATVFILTLGALIAIWIRKSESSIPIPDNSAKNINPLTPKSYPTVTIKDVKNNLINYRVSKINYDLKNETGWKQDWLGEQLRSIGMEKIAVNAYMKRGERVDETFLVAISSYDEEAYTQFLTTAQRVASINTKRSYVFITGGTYKYKESSQIAINCRKDDTLFFTLNRDIQRKLKLCTVNEPYTASLRPDRLVVIRSTEQLDEHTTILKLCNFNLIVFSLYDGGYFDE